MRHTQRSFLLSFLVFACFFSGEPVEEVIIRSPLGKESIHSLNGSSGIVRIPVDTR